MLRSLALITIAIVVASAALSQESLTQRPPSEQQTGSSTESQKPPDNQQDMPTPRPNIATPEPIESRRDAATQHSKSSDEQSNWLEKFFYEIKITDILLVIFTGALAVYTGRLWYATAGLWESAQEQSRDMQKSLAIAKTSATAAEASAAVLPIIEGAYVFPDIIANHVAESLSAFEQSEVRTNRLIVEFQIKNFGRTPALIQTVDADLLHPDSLTSLRSSDADPRKTVKKTILGAGEPTERLQTEIADFSRDEAIQIRNGQTRLLFTGRIFYFDVWGQRWAFFFDWEYSPSQGRFIPNHRPREKA
jgi:hypothetical protein